MCNSNKQQLEQLTKKEMLKGRKRKVLKEKERTKRTSLRLVDQLA